MVPGPIRALVAVEKGGSDLPGPKTKYPHPSNLIARGRHHWLTAQSAPRKASVTATAALLDFPPSTSTANAMSPAGPAVW